MAQRRRLVVITDDNKSAQSYLPLLSDKYDTVVLNEIGQVPSTLQGLPADAIVLFGGVATMPLFETLTAAKINHECAIFHVGQASDVLVSAAQHGYTFNHFNGSISPRDLRLAVDASMQPRSAHRFEVAVHTVCGISPNGSNFECPMLDISNTGLSFLLPSWMDVRGFLPSKEIGQLAVRRGPHVVLEPVDVTVRQIQPATGHFGGGYKIGVEFAGRRQGEQASTGTIRDAVRIAALVRDAVQHRQVWANVLDDTTRARVVAAKPAVGQDSSLLALEMDGPLAVDTGSPLQISFEADGARHWFVTGAADVPSDACVVVRLPRAIRRVRNRRGGRVNMTANPQIEVEIETPFGASLRSRPALDISLQGIAFNIDSKTELTPVGTRLHAIRLRFGDGSVLELRGVVKSLALPEDAQITSAKCGVQFDPLTIEQQAPLMDAIVNGGAHAAHSGMINASGLSFDTVWGFLRSTGFIYPEKEERLLPVMDHVRRNFTALLKKPNHLSTALVFRRGGEVVAHIASIRSYSKTWMVHHLGATKRQAGDPQVLRMILLGFSTFWDLRPDIEWLNMFFRPNNGWPRRALGGFATMVESPISQLRTYSYLTAPTDDHNGVEPFAKILPAKPHHLAQIEAHALATLGPLEFQAQDLSQFLIGLPELQQDYASMGLQRQREIWVAEDQQGVAGYALLNISSIGLNLSELLSTFRVHMIRPSEQAMTGLVVKGLQRYRENGRNVAVAMVPRGEEEVYTRHGFAKKKEYASWIWNRSLIRKYLEYVDRTTRVSQPPNERREGANG